MGTAFVEACCDIWPELCSPPANQVSLALRINLFSYCGYVTPFVVDAFSWDYLLFGDCEFGHKAQGTQVSFVDNRAVSHCSLLDEGRRRCPRSRDVSNSCPCALHNDKMGVPQKDRPGEGIARTSAVSVARR